MSSPNHHPWSVWEAGSATLRSLSILHSLCSFNVIVIAAFFFSCMLSYKECRRERALTFERLACAKTIWSSPPLQSSPVQFSDCILPLLVGIYRGVRHRLSRCTIFPDFCDFQIWPADFPPSWLWFLADFSNAQVFSDKKGCDLTCFPDFYWVFKAVISDL